jgi:ABC-type transporter Mla MlaB component
MVKSRTEIEPSKDAARRSGAQADARSNQGSAIGDYFRKSERAAPRSQGAGSSLQPPPATDVLKSELPDMAEAAPGGLLPSAGSDEAGPLTEAAFTRLPSVLDMSAGARRPVSAKDLPGALEDCALSFANGQPQEALQRLETALASAELEASWRVQAWLMRFDLYTLLGMKEQFESHALEFATLFERTPPVWHDEVDDQDDVDDLIVPSVAITGTLSQQSQAPLSALRKTVERYQGVRLDFERLDGADSDGCRCLLVTAQSLRRAGKVVRVLNEQRLLDVLAPHLRTGDQDSDPMIWLLALEILQAREDEEAFEELAIQYATTFEVSPPSWQGATRKAESQPMLNVADKRFCLEGEVLQPLTEVLEQLEVYTTQHESVVVEMSHLTRIDFVSCSQITNVLAKAQQSGRRIEIRSPNEMTAALLVLMGAADFASIVPRR